jgi:hypothetical protein
MGFNSASKGLIIKNHGQGGSLAVTDYNKYTKYKI